SGRTLGSGSCPGCSTPVGITLDEIQLYQSPEYGFDPILTTPLNRTDAYWQRVPFTLISRFTPPGGPPGADVTIEGANLTGASSVRFDTVSAVFSVESDAIIHATAPANVRTGPIHVTAPLGTATSNASFIVTPVIRSFFPTQAPVGFVVSISGLNFTAVTSVTFDGAPAAF